ncbi:gastrula zinc finger protein XlCGF8.2DB-like [Uloborus diversus]|uniref:gastrula zinc finger protein XlCGF8.2DB-like n=2 Tax=Uloborus diversus TaxID=327109 RepID=UPI00240A3684|nr:gastrula zinc finger protein XlCGF8.2DB-like [Uloborus diversus]
MSNNQLRQQEIHVITEGQIDSHGNLIVVCESPLCTNEANMVHENQVCQKENKKRGTVRERSNVCELCDKSFSTEEKFQEHYLIHSGIKPHVCEICLKGFANKSNLQRHRLTHSAEKPFTCEVCSKGFADKYTFQMHKSIHFGEKHVCDICYREFTQKSNLKRHYTNHSEYRPHGCGLCGKRFTDKYTLETHLAIHTGEKYVCDVCFQGFTQKSNLKRHYMLHFADKPFTCEECGKSYADNYTFQVHKSIHSGQRHICDICSRGFTQKSNLKRHYTTHLKEKKFHYCHHCPKKFIREEKLQKHELTHRL